MSLTQNPQTIISSPNYASRIFMAVTLSILLVSVAVFFPSVPVQASGSSPKIYDIPAGSLEEVLNSFAVQSGITLSFDPELVRNRNSPGIQGRYSVAKALEVLLEGKGLEPVETSSGAYSIKYSNQAQDPEGQGTELPTVHVTARSDPGTGSHDIPVERIRRNIASDMADVFAGEPSVSVGGGARNAQRIYLRGIEGSNLNITIDGARQGRNLHQHRGGIGGIDPDLLKRVQVQTGPGADQGPGALGGSIVFETVDAQDLLATDREFGARIKGGYASADRSWNGGTTLYGKLMDDLGLLAHFSGTDRKDYRRGQGGKVTNTAAEDMDYFLKLSLLEINGHSLRVGAERNTSRGDYLWGQAGSDMGYAPKDSDPARQVMKRDTYTFEHRYNGDSPLLDWKINLYANESSLENRDTETEVMSREFGGDVRNTASFDFGITHHSLSMGVDYYEEDGISKPAQGSRRSNESRNLGVFLQDRMTIGRVGLSLGARLDDYSSDYGPKTVSGSEVSPHIRGELNFTDKLSVFAGYGEAVRGSGIIPVGWMANIVESTNFNDGKGFEPEKSKQREAGVLYHTSGLFLGDDYFRAGLTVFDIRLKNTIERVGGGGGPVAKIANNPDEITTKGYEISAAWGWKNYETSLGFSSFKTEDSDGDPVGVVRRKVGSTGNRFVWDNRWTPLDNLVLGYTLTAVARLKDVPDDQKERPGYAVHSVQAEWHPAKIQGLSLAVAVHNLFDKRYADHTSIYSQDTGVVHEPGRDFRLAVTYRF